MGNARLSRRSLVFTLSFMVAGMLTATFSGTADALGIARRSSLPPHLGFKFEGASLPGGVLSTAAAMPARLYGSLWPEMRRQGGMVMGTAAATMAATSLLAAAPQGQQWCTALELVGEAFAGLWFALGLAFSGMVRPSKVAAFLSV